jgi:hypothetical protein
MLEETPIKNSTTHLNNQNNLNHLTFVSQLSLFRSK